MTNNANFVVGEKKAIVFLRATQYHRQQAVEIIDESHPYFHAQGKITNISRDWNLILVSLAQINEPLKAQKPEQLLTFWLKPEQVKIVLKSML